MTVDTSAGDVALGQLAALPFHNIIGGPLTAAIEAQAMAAATTADFIRTIGLQEVGGKLEAINVDFTYQDGTGASRRLSAPILTILPIPFIVIETVDIEFKARIAASAQQSTEETSTKEGGLGGSLSGWARLRRRRGISGSLSGSYSSKKDSKASQESRYSVEYTMDVRVHATQTGIPQGMSQILNILQDAITSKPESHLYFFGLPGVLKFSTLGNSPEKFTVMATDAGGDPVSSYAITVALAPSNFLTHTQTGTNPVEVSLAAAGTGPTGPTDVVLTVTATPAPGSGLPTLTTTRTISVEP